MTKRHCAWCGLEGHYDSTCWIRVGGRHERDAIDDAVSELAVCGRDRLVARLRMRAVLEAAVESGADLQQMRRRLSERGGE